MAPTRRTYLRVVGASTTAGMAALAGCAGGGEESTPTDTAADDGGESTPTDTTAADAGKGPDDGDETTDDGTSTGATADCETGGETLTVDMGGSGHGPFFFDPVGLFVNPGDTVEFVNETSGHSATSYHESLDSSDVTRIPDAAEPFNSGTMNTEGAVWQYTFEVPGTYDYFCIPHQGVGMIGRLVVCQPGGPAEEGSPPDGDLPDSGRIVEQGSVSWEEWDE